MNSRTNSGNREPISNNADGCKDDLVKTPHLMSIRQSRHNQVAAST